MDLRYYLTQNLVFSIGSEIGARLRFGQNLGRSETQTPLVTSGGHTQYDGLLATAHDESIFLRQRWLAESPPKAQVARIAEQPVSGIAGTRR